MLTYTSLNDTVKYRYVKVKHVTNNISFVMLDVYTLSPGLHWKGTVNIHCVYTCYTYVKYKYLSWLYWIKISTPKQNNEKTVYYKKNILV